MRCKLNSVQYSTILSVLYCIVLYNTIPYAVRVRRTHILIGDNLEYTRTRMYKIGEKCQSLSPSPIVIRVCHEETPFHCQVGSSDSIKITI